MTCLRYRGGHNAIHAKQPETLARLFCGFVAGSERIKRVICCIGIFLYMLLFCPACRIGVVSASENTLSGKYSVIVEAMDWGPVVTGVLLEFEETVDRISPEMIGVLEKRQGGEDRERTVSAAYLSDKDGNRKAGASEYVYLELLAEPSEGSLLVGTVNSVWDSSFELQFSLRTPLYADGLEYGQIRINTAFQAWTMPQGDRFLYRAYSSNSTGIRHHCASFIPQEDDHTNPLIVWLHGGGEGGSDASVAVMGMNVSALTEDPIQEKMGGAYVLVPQAPTMWMDGYSPVSGGKSIYTESLMELIRWYVEVHPDIDPHRIYIGGASNGGYMTLEMLISYPGYFAAGFPICSGYAADTLSEEQLLTLTQTPLWFLYAESDTTLPPSYYSEPVISRLKAAGMENLHVSSPEEVIDPTGRYFEADGTPYRYDGHASWIYALNSASYDDDDANLELFEWLSAQRLETLPAEENNPFLFVLGGAALVLFVLAIILIHCKHKRQSKSSKP